MVSKNNQIKYEKWNTNRKPHYGLRKLSIGVASVLLGTTLYWGGTTVLADTNDAVTPPTQETEQTTANSAGSSIQQSSVKLTGAQSQSEQTNSANQKNATNDFKVPSAKAVDPSTLTESKAATADDSLATGMTEDDYLNTLKQKENSYQLLSPIKRVVTMNKPGGTQVINQSLIIRKIGGDSNKEALGGNTEFNTNLSFIATINNDGKSSSKIIFKTRFTASSINGKIYFNTADDKQKYENLMNLDNNSDLAISFPAIDTSQFNVPGYTYTISPANSNLGEWTFQPYQTKSVNIEVNYTKNAKHTVTYEFVDQNGKPVGTATQVSGLTGSEQDVKLTVPTGYQLVSGNLPTTVTIPDNDQTVTINVKKDQQKVTIQVTGNSSMDYGDNTWQQLVKDKNVPTGFSVVVTAADGTTEPVQLTDGDLEVQGTPGNVGSYKVVLTAHGLQDTKEQLGTDDFTYPDLTDVTSSATLDIQKKY